MHADLAAYDVDPLAVDDVAGLRPILTVVAGTRSLACLTVRHDWYLSLFRGRRP